MAPNANYFQYWAKSGDTAADFHLLPYHLLDVAAVCQELMQRIDGAEAHLSALLGLEDGLVDMFTWLAGLHDIGKFANSFQSLAPEIQGSLGGSMPVAKPLSRPLVLVVSPDSIPADVQIENSPHKLAGFNAFVGGSLKQAMEPYFAAVEVAASADEAPVDPHYIADVKLTRVVAKPITAGGLTYTTIVMEWSMGLRASEAEDYVFSLVAESPSDPQYATLDEGAKQMMKAAINGLQQQWTEKDVFKQLREFEAGPQEPAPAEEPEPTEEN